MQVTEKRDWLSVLDSRWSLAQRFGALPVIGSILGGSASYFTRMMQQYAPFSLFAGAVLGAICFQLWAMFGSIRRERDERARRISLLMAPKGQINPAARRYENQRVFLSDIMPPFGVVLSGKEFRNCEIVGPANIVMIATREGGAELVDNHMYDCEGVVVAPGTHVKNCLVLADCSLKECSIYKFTILVAENEFDFIAARLPGVNWLNRAAPIPKAETSSA